MMVTAGPRGVYSRRGMSSHRAGWACSLDLAVGLSAELPTYRSDACYGILWPVPREDLHRAVFSQSDSTSHNIRPSTSNSPQPKQKSVVPRPVLSFCSLSERLRRSVAKRHAASPHALNRCAARRAVIHKPCARIDAAANCEHDKPPCNVLCAQQNPLRGDTCRWYIRIPASARRSMKK